MIKLRDVHYSPCLKSVLVTFLSVPRVFECYLIQGNMICFVESGKMRSHMASEVSDKSAKFSFINLSVTKVSYRNPYS